MNIAIKKTVFVCLLFIVFSAIPLRADKALNLLPVPKSVEILGGSIKLEAVKYITLPEAYEMALPNSLERLPQSERKGLGVTFVITNAGVPSDSEGYTLKVDRSGIVISSTSHEGLFYGSQTLSQLMQDARDSDGFIPCVRILDYPDMSFRAIHIDTKHHLDRIEYYYQLVDRLSSYKVNNIIWELEDKLGYTRHPEIAASNAISIQEMQSICRYAKERNIRIHPLVQGLGHAPYILKHHVELRENPHSDWEMCPSNPKTYDFLFDLYEEAIEAMPYCEYLHIGGDEISEIGIDERCRETGKTPFELQMEWLRKVCDFAKEHGKTPIFWDDMPLKFSNLWWLLHRPLTDDEILANWNTEKLDEALALFPKDCVYMRWHYDDPTKLSHKLLLSWYKEHDLKVYGATAASSGETPYIPRMESRVQYIKDFCTLASDNNFGGIIATAWDDESNHYETVMRGFAALGTFSWNSNSGSVSEYVSLHAKREWGLDGTSVSFISEMEKTADFFDHALVDAGVRNPAYEIDGNFTLITMPSKDSVGVWTSKYAERINKAHIEDARYSDIVNGIRNAKRNALRNRYALDVYDATNELFHYPVELILALEKYDRAPLDKKKDVLDELTDLCDSFKQRKERLIEIYGKTRYMAQPYGYIQDLNHHRHLAAWTFNSDWIFYFEQPMTDKVVEWINLSK